MEMEIEITSNIEKLKLYIDQTNEIISKSDIQVLLNISNAIENLANLSRESANRMLVGSNHGIKLVLRLVQKAATESSLFEEDRNEQTNTSLKVIEQSLRLLNNVYADNKEAETNAAFMLDSSNIGNLFTLLKNLNNKIQCFVERNSQSEHQQDFARDIVRLTGILMSALFNVNYSTKKNTELMSTNKDSYTQLVRIFELENLCAKAHSEYRSLAELIHSDYWEYAIDNSAEILDELISVGTVYVDIFANDSTLLKSMINYLHLSTTTGIWDSSRETMIFTLSRICQASEAISKQVVENKLIQKLFELLKFLLGKDIPAETGDEHPTHTPIAYPKRIEMLIVTLLSITSNDSCIDKILSDKELLDSLAANLTGNPQEKCRIVVEGMGYSSLLFIGNLCRNDAASKYIVDTLDIRSVVENWYSRKNTYRDIRSSCAASGLLKNLCVFNEYKLKMAEFGVLENAVLWLDSSMVPILFDSIGILKRMIMPNSESKHRACDVLLMPAVSNKNDSSNTSDNNKNLLFINTLVSVIENSDIDAVICEGTRLLILFIKSVFLDTKKFDSNQFEQVLKPIDVFLPIIKLIVVYDDKKYQITRQEGLQGLCILSAVSEQYAQLVVNQMNTELTTKTGSSSLYKTLKGILQEQSQRSEATGLENIKSSEYYMFNQTLELLKTVSRHSSRLEETSCIDSLLSLVP